MHQAPNTTNNAKIYFSDKEGLNNIYIYFWGCYSHLARTGRKSEQRFPDLIIAFKFCQLGAKKEKEKEKKNCSPNKHGKKKVQTPPAFFVVNI